MKKQLPLPIRDHAQSFSINNPDDDTPIREMFKINDGLLLVTDKCTYHIRLADQIDPDRKNPTLSPCFQQKLFDHGISSELLCRTLIQAKALFKKEFLSIDVDEALQLSFDALNDLISMNELEQKFKSSEQAVIDKAQKLERKDASFPVPGLGDVLGSCKSFTQKADHFVRSLIALVRLFYPEMKGKNWDQFQEIVEHKYGKEDSFFTLMELATPFLLLIRNSRDCLEHKNSKGVTVWDFEPQVSGSIMLPSIEINFRGSSIERQSISSFMEDITINSLDFFESIIAHMCSKNADSFAGLPLVVNILSEEQQEAWHVRFGYGTFDETGHFMAFG